MICTTRRSALRGTIACPASKSYTHRALFVASLADGSSAVRGALDSLDTRATARACAAFGATVDGLGTREVCIVGRPHPRAASINAENSGTTLRIAAAVAALSPETTELTGDASLCRRPVMHLVDALESMGAACESAGGTPPLSVRGPVGGGRVSVQGNVSSQFVSALLIMAPCTPDGMAISVEGTVVSQPYIDATISVMRRFGAHVEERSAHRSYFVAPRRYSPATIDVPSDYSSAALLLAASVLTGDSLCVSAGDAGMPQGDTAFLGMLDSMGVRVSDADGALRTASPDVLRGGSFDLSDTPDLLPPLAILSLRCPERMEITGIAHARTKETDRIAVLAEQLARLGVRTSQRDDALLLWHDVGSEPHGASLDSCGDHRIFMALCIAGLALGETTVDGAESASVSYPGFVDDMRRVGAQIELGA